MVGEDKVLMRVTALRRVHVIRQRREKTLTSVKAGTMLGLTARHIRRCIERVTQAGDQGLAHQGRGQPSDRRIPGTVKTTVLMLYEQRPRISGRRWRRRRWPSVTGSRAATRPCGGGYGRAASCMSHGKHGRIGRGALTWGSAAGVFEWTPV